jgi:O-antigen/teichoic acid export membrane protein
VSQLKKNIIANLVGSGWVVLMGIVCIPVYIKFLGIDSYGLIGIYTSLQALFGLLDIGLSTTLNREMARLSGQTNMAREMRDLVRTLESIYWILGLVIAGAIILLAPLIANYWIQPGKLSPRTIQHAIMIMGLAIAFQFFFTFYSGGLLGLQKQILLNIIIIIINTLKFPGVILVLWLISPSIQAFFIWQSLVSILATFLVAHFLWKNLPSSGQRAGFRIRFLQEVWQFTLGMGGINILALILTQMDKIVLSKMLTLENFGYYTLASGVAVTLYSLIGPIFNAAYPKFTQLVSIGDQFELKKLYHGLCQLMSVIIIPPTLVIAFFSSEILLLWTRNSVIAKQSHTILSLLIVGTALNGLMALPYALQIASGWTKLTFYTNLIAVVILVPSIMYMTKWYGSVGAAIVWVALNCSYIIINIQLMHRRLMPDEKRRWYFQDIGMPIGLTLLIAMCWTFFLPQGISGFWLLLYLVIIWLTCVIAAILGAPQLSHLIYVNLTVKKETKSLEI